MVMARELIFLLVINECRTIFTIIMIQLDRFEHVIKNAHKLLEVINMKK
jgi:hypothetical protein